MGSSPEWTKPELIVLGRGAPEENVLCKCKQAWDHDRSCGSHNKHTNCWNQGNRPNPS
jgi:hypothetical protein